MSNEFTPGPWTAVTLDDAGREIAFALVQAGSRLYMIGPENEHMPNARLIAAAPELLEALEGLLSIITDGLGNAAEAVAARAAIAKARGHE